jgi:hypothetical protein
VKVPEDAERQAGVLRHAVALFGIFLVGCWGHNS